LSTPRVPDGVMAQPSAPQFSSSQAVHSSVLSAETFRRNGDVDADREAPFGPRDQRARIARRCVPRLFYVWPSYAHIMCGRMCGRARVASEPA
jgi:hypothetical protein